MSRRPYSTADLPENFQAKIVINDDTGCWEWNASRTPDGYGVVSYPPRSGRTRNVHRVVYELLIGPIPEGLTIDHLCRVRHCVNPAHLDPCTHQMNCRRGKIHRRYTKGLA